MASRAKSTISPSPREPQAGHGGESASLTLPLLMLAARPALALTAQSALALVLRAAGRPAPFRAAAGWWMVYGSAVDVGCLTMIAAAARREGLPMREAVGLGARPARRRRAVLLDVAALTPATVLSQLLDRSLNPGRAEPYPPQIRASRLGGFARAYSVSGWPALWALGEEATYLGYVLPRLERRLGLPTAAVLTALAWAAQHAAIPALPGRRDGFSRVIAMLPVSAAFVFVYVLRGRRLVPLIAAHWTSDASAAVLAAVVAGRSGKR